MKKYVLLFFTLLSVHQLLASHIRGAEMTYRHVGNGKFIFNIHFYRFCNGINFPIDTLIIQNIGLPNLGDIACKFKEAYSIGPNCTAIGNNIQLNCPDPLNSSNAPSGATAKYIFESDTIDLSTAPQLQANQYYFFYCMLACCLNLNSNTLDCSGIGYLISHVKMYPYFDADSNRYLSLAEIGDNSPVFEEDPQSLTFIDTTEITYRNDNAIDSDNDLLSYNFSNPLSYLQTHPILSFEYCNYIYNLPGNLPFYGIVTPLDTLSGAIPIRVDQQGKSLPNGYLIYEMCVKSYRNNQLISEVFRNFNFVSTFKPSDFPIDQKDPIIYNSLVTNPSSPIQNVVEATYFVGDTISFIVEAKDSFPVALQQKLSLFIKSPFLNLDTSLVNLCPLQPCPTIRSWPDSTLLISPIYFNTSKLEGYGFEQFNHAGLKFTWVPECKHLINNNQTTTYALDVYAKDDICPYPGKAKQTIKIHLLPLPKLKSPQISNISVGQNGVEISLNNSIIDSINILPGNSTLAESIQRQNQSFRYFEIMRSDSLNGPYTSIRKVTDLSRDFAIDKDTLTSNIYYYFTRTFSGCLDTIGISSDTVIINLADTTLNLKSPLTMDIFPNPTTENRIGLSLNHLEKGDISISIIDKNGKVIYNTTKVNQGETNQNYELRLPLIPGVYVVKTTNNNKSVSKKIVVQ